MNSTLYKQAVAESLAAFVLTFAISVSLQSETLVPTPVIAAAVVGVFVYTIGGLSGAQINPAVTIALLAINKIGKIPAIVYIVAQCVGAGLAAILVASIGGSAPFTVGNESIQIILGEALGTFILMFGITAVVMKKVHENVSGIVIGSSLLVGIVVAAVLSGGVLNPAVALGLGATSFSYLLAPIAGGVAGSLFYRALHS